jgi:outer membrane protein assembly factor BamD
MDKSDYSDANRCYESVRARFGGSGITEEAELRMADISFEKKDYLMAGESYRAFAKLHPSHAKLPYVYYKAGLAYLKESPKALDRDQQYLEEAIGYLEIGARYFPGSAYEELTRQALAEARRRIGGRHLYVGKFYYKRKEYRSSLPRFAEVADDFRDLGIDEEALYLMAKAYIKLEEKSKAFEVAAVLKSRHPNSKYLNKLLGDLGVD